MKILLFTIILVVLSACENKITNTQDNTDYSINKSEIGCEINQTGPSFKAVLLDNTLLDLKDYRGKVVLLDFWAVWCPHCNYTRPILKEISRDYSNDTNLVIIGISVNDLEKKWREYISEKELNWLHIQNSAEFGASPKSLYCIEGIPAVVVLDKWGRIRAKVNPNNTQIITNSINELLSE